MTAKRSMDFMIHRPMEFLYALIDASLVDSFLEEDDVKPDKTIMELISSMKLQLSKFTLSELNYFFDMDVNLVDGLGQVILWNYIIDNPSIATVPDLINLIENDSENNMFIYLVKYAVSENKNKSIEELYDVDDVKNDMHLMLNIIQNLNLCNIPRREKLIECLKNPYETKQRFCFLLNQFYEKAYTLYEDETINKLTPYVKKYESLFNDNPEKFSRDFLFKDLEVFSYSVNVHISYFRYVGSDYYASTNANNKTEWIALGYKLDEYFGDIPRREKIYKFLKAVSDKKRLDIIELLSQKSWYVNEIADEMKMTSATASYHLTSLQELDIVDFERSDHRFYYYLNKEVLSNLFDEAKNFLLHD